MNFEDERYIETLSQMVKIPTIAVSDDRPTAQVQAFHNYVSNRFPALMSKAIKIDKFDGGIMLFWKGKNSSKKPLAMMSHFDVAEVDGEWTFEPFSGEVKDGKILGRGTADTKSSLCAFLESGEKLAKEGFEPESDIYFLSSSREEIAGKDARLMADYFEKNNIHPSLLIDEGGAILDRPLSFIKSPFAMIAMSERSSAKIILEGDQKQVDKFAKCALKSKFVENNFPAEVEEMFHRMTPKMDKPFNKLFKHFNVLKPLLLFALPKVSKEAGAMVAPSISFKSENGTNFLRVACTYHHNIDVLCANIVAKAQKFGVVASVADKRNAPLPTDFNADGVKLVEETVRKTFPDTTPTPFIIFGGTDARHFVKVSDCVVRFAPLIMNGEIVSRVHKPDEYIFEKSVTQAVRFYYNLIVDFQKR